MSTTPVPAAEAEDKAGAEPLSEAMQKLLSSASGAGGSSKKEKKMKALAGGGGASVPKEKTATPVPGA